MAKYRKKQVVIKAVQLRWDTWNEMCDHAGVGRLEDGKPQGSQDGNAIGLDIPTSEGLLHAVENDWIIRDVTGALDSCKPDIFEITYEPLDSVSPLRGAKTSVDGTTPLKIGKNDVALEIDEKGGVHKAAE